MHIHSTHYIQVGHILGSVYKRSAVTYIPMQDVCEPSKSGVGLSEDGGGQPVQTGTHGEDRLKECSAGKGEMASQKKGCDVSNFLLDSCDLSSTAMDPKDSLPDSSNEPSHLLSERELQICSQ